MLENKKKEVRQRPKKNNCEKKERQRKIFKPLDDVHLQNPFNISFISDVSMINNNSPPQLLKHPQLPKKKA